MNLLDIPSAEARRRLLETLRRESVRRGEFTLSSGAKSTLYVDVRRTTTHPEGALLIARLFLERIAEDGIDAAGGPTLGADPIVGAMAALSALRGRPLPAFIVRNETKAHGMQQRIEGHCARGWRVVVLDDVVTGGGSIGNAVAAVREAGADVVRLLAVVDRRSQASPTLNGVPFFALFSIGEVLDADPR